jgi:hypothetical protein
MILNDISMYILLHHIQAQMIDICQILSEKISLLVKMRPSFKIHEDTILFCFVPLGH